MTVVLLHAFPLDERMWEPQRKALSDHQAVTPRLYPLGASMDDWARRVVEDTGRSRNAGLRGEGIVAVGASMGGYCALRLLAHADVRALLLAGSRADADTPERREAREETIRLIGEEGLERLWEVQRPRLFSADADAASLERARELTLAQDPEELAIGVAAMRDRPDSTPLVRETEAAVLVTVGELDPFFTVAEAEALAREAPNGRAHVFEGCGHLPSLERSEEFNRVLKEFLDEL
jgi:pimeloyl-ACP methyl ester carboxylesterase